MNKRFFISLFLVLCPLFNLYTQNPSWTKGNSHYHDTVHFEEQNERAFVLEYNYLSEKYNVKVFSRKFSDGFIKKYIFNNTHQLIKQITIGKDTTYLFEEKYYYSGNNRLDSISTYQRKDDGSESIWFKKYTYDQSGNIKTVKKKGGIIVYNYDSLNRIKERNSYSKEDTVSWIVSYFKKPGKSMTLIQKDSTNYYKYIYNDKNKLIKKIEDGEDIEEYYYWEGNIIREIKSDKEKGYIKHIILYRYKNNEVKYFSHNFSGDFSHTFLEFNSFGLPAKETLYELCQQYAPENCRVKQESTYEYEFFDE
jgi:hypothetical protein